MAEPDLSVLVIDDDELVRRSLSRVLRRNATVSQASGAEEARRMVRDHAFDVVLCDHNLLDGDGLDLLEELTLLRPGAHLVLMTGAYVESGRWPVLQKPFSFAEVRAHLRPKSPAA